MSRPRVLAGGRGGGAQGLVEGPPGRTAGPAHGAHPLAQLGLVVLHHVENTLHVGVHRVAGAGRLKWGEGDGGG